MISKLKGVLAAVMGFGLCLGSGPAAEPRSLGDLVNHPEGATVPDMLAVLDQEAGKSDSSFEFGRVFANACRRADGGTLPKFIRIFNAWSAPAYVKGAPFAVLAEAWLRLRTPETLPTRLVFPDPPPEPRAAPEDYPEELRRAAECYLQVAEPFRKLRDARISREKGVDFQTHESEYWRLIGQLLEGKDGPFAGQLLAYRWGGGCGTGSDAFEDPQSHALVLALAADGRWAEAAGAALSVAPSPETDGAIRVLSACVPDPRQVVIGGLAFLATRPDGVWLER
ncbi:MAG TPA: hypothetical protein VIS74_01085, partial [Chthoniobacterales bacterium]